MQTIGIDCRFASTSSGLGRYTRELTTALLERGGAHYVLFVRSEREPWIPAIASASMTVHVAPFPHYSLAEQTRFPSVLRRAGIDLLFCPHFNVPWFCPVPFVVTIHDLILHRFPNNAHLLKQAAYRLLMVRAISRAERIICVSAFAADEVRKTYGRSAKEKISVIHEAVSPSFQPVASDGRERITQKYRLDKPYFLYVGNAKQHKNVGVLIDAFTALDDASRELVLVTGGKEVADMRLPPGVRLLHDIPDADLPALYSGALCFVSASLYEGFGLPLLEAHACGCPAIVSDQSSFPEIAPPGTLLIEPTVQIFAAAMRTPPAWQPAESVRTWSDVATETAGVFGKVMRV